MRFEHSVVTAVLLGVVACVGIVGGAACPSYCVNDCANTTAVDPSVLDAYLAGNFLSGAPVSFYANTSSLTLAVRSDDVRSAVAVYGLDVGDVGWLLASCSPGHGGCPWAKGLTWLAEPNTTQHSGHGVPLRGNGPAWVYPVGEAGIVPEGSLEGYLHEAVSQQETLVSPAAHNVSVQWPATPPQLTPSLIALAGMVRYSFLVDGAKAISSSHAPTYKAALALAKTLQKHALPATASGAPLYVEAPVAATTYRPDKSNTFYALVMSQVLVATVHEMIAQALKDSGHKATTLQSLWSGVALNATDGLATAAIRAHVKSKHYLPYGAEISVPRGAGNATVSLIPSYDPATQLIALTANPHLMDTIFPEQSLLEHTAFALYNTTRQRSGVMECSVLSCSLVGFSYGGPNGTLDTQLTALGLLAARKLVEDVFVTPEQFDLLLTDVRSLSRSVPLASQQCQVPAVERGGPGRFVGLLGRDRYNEARPALGSTALFAMGLRNESPFSLKLVHTPEPSTPLPATPVPTTPVPPTPEPTTETPEPVTPVPSTPEPETPAPNTTEPSTPVPVTPEPSTPVPPTPAPPTPVPSGHAPPPPHHGPKLHVIIGASCAAAAVVVVIAVVVFVRVRMQRRQALLASSEDDGHLGFF